MEVTSAMKGYPSLKVGQTVMGRLVDCKNKLISFSGRVLWRGRVPIGYRGMAVYCLLTHPEFETQPGLYYN